ncbi:MAG: quinol:cytochrome C oxidoreductase [Flavobacteriales bacterium]|nr:quinol:cytochrome C oxidoreductase [Flavobacteriales bacterium]
MAVARLWSNLLINGFFFLGISVAALFFFAVNYAAESGWWVVLKRVLEAIGAYLPFGAVVLLLVFIAGAMHWHHLYHWMDPAVSDPSSASFDEIIAGKGGYLNLPFFFLRFFLFVGVWYWFWKRFRTRSLEEDLGFERSRHFRNVRDAAIFLVFFGYSSSAASWDWIMSIDTHWFSTLFGWYTFSGMWLTAMVTLSLLVIWLKKLGYLQQVNESHIHDIGKWVFATAFLWTYLFFSQFMLIWYSNIPEEVTYFMARINHYPWLYWGMFTVNFIFPLIALMDRDSKRNKYLLTITGIVLLCSHWANVYLMVTPGTMQQHGSIGLIEVGMALGFAGLFIFVVLNALAKAPLVARNHPFYEESLHHEIH